MCCQAEPTGVGDALAVDDEDIRLFLQLFDRGNADGGLAKREQAGDIGESYFSPGADCFDDFKVAEVVARPSPQGAHWAWPCFHPPPGGEPRATFEHDHSRQYPLAVLAEGTIDPRDRLWRASKGGMPHFARQPLLQISGLWI